MTGEIIVNEFEEVIAIPEESTIDESSTEEPIMEVQPSGPVEVTMAIGSGQLGCELTNECFLPYQIEIGSGETVTWNNIDSAAHTVTSGVPPTSDGNFDSGMIMVNQSWEFTFTDSGEFDYYCMVHPWMAGKVVVS